MSIRNDQDLQWGRNLWSLLYSICCYHTTQGSVRQILHCCGFIV